MGGNNLKSLPGKMRLDINMADSAIMAVRQRNVHLQDVHILSLIILFRRNRMTAAARKMSIQNVTPKSAILLSRPRMMSDAILR